MQAHFIDVTQPLDDPGLTADSPPEHANAIGRRRWRGICRAIVVAGLLCGLLAATHGWLLTAWARFLDVSERPHKVDYALILGANVTTRPFVAAALANRGFVDQVLIVQPWLSPEAEDGIFPADHILTRQILLRLQVAPERIVQLAGEVTSTYDEAQALQRFLRDRPQATVSVVTNPFHTRRARIIFGRVLKDQMRRVSFVAAPCDGFDETNWWRVEDGARTYVLETLKFFYTLAGRNG